MRILHVVNSLGVGGVEVGVVNVMRGLGELGYEQAVCCLEHDGALRGRVPASIAVWVCGRAGRRERYAPLWRAATLMRSFQPAIVHARNCGAWRNGAFAWLLAGCPGRLVFSIHGLDWVGCIDKRRALLYRQLARLTSGLVAVSDATARRFAADTGIPPERFTVLHSGVDTQVFQPRRPPYGPVGGCGRVVLGSVARLGQQKGHQQLIEAFALAAAQCCSRLELRLIGDGPCRVHLQALVRGLGLDDRVHFLGEREDVPAQLAQMDFFILASQQEGRPTAIMEAMAAGLAVVATRVGAVAELVVDGQTGILVCADDVAALSRAILALADDAQRRLALGQAGRVLAQDRFALADMVQSYGAFYAKTAGYPRRPRWAGPVA